MHSVRHFRSGGRANARKVQKRTMDKKGKQQFLLVAFGVALYAALMNLNEVAAFLTRLATLFTPVIIGFIDGVCPQCADAGHRRTFDAPDAKGKGKTH